MLRKDEDFNISTQITKILEESKDCTDLLSEKVFEAFREDKESSILSVVIKNTQGGLPELKKKQEEKNRLLYEKYRQEM